MKEQNSVYIRKITQTAVFLALLIVFQLLTAPVGQYLTGSIVNFILIVCTMTAGLYSGIIIALLSPILAFSIGIGPAVVQIIPFIMLGNLILVLAWYLISKYLHFKKAVYLSYCVSAVAAALLKFLAFYIGLIKIALPLFLSNGLIKTPQVAVLSAAFSFPQLITALVGGIFAVILIPQLKKIIK